LRQKNNPASDMIISPDLIENFKFLTLEIRKQVEETVKCIEDPENFSLSRLMNSGDYADNLRNLITRKSYKLIINSEDTEKTLIDSMIALNTIATNLERIGDFCENIVKQLDFFNHPAFIRRYDYNDYFKVIFSAIDNIVDALITYDVKKALTITEAEILLDAIYKRDFDLILPELKNHKVSSQDLLTAMFIFRYLERIGDSLLNIGEAIISASIGTKLKISQYLSLRDSLDEDSFRLHKIGGETRSGCIIEKVVTNQPDSNWDEVIFKEGKLHKLEEEKAKLDRWQEIIPGLAPRVLEFKQLDKNAMILMEFLQGSNYQEILIGADLDILSKANNLLMETMRFVWDSTKKAVPISAQFIPQLKKRLPDILKVHPEFKTGNKKIGTLSHKTLDSLVNHAEKMEKNMLAPFSVMIHGDFNNDNIIYNTTNNCLHLIDLHRSSLSDYVQDVSVFLISNYRMPVFDDDLRERMNITNIQFYRFAQLFAKQHSDTTFEVRLTLGLVRSLITSTRFILNDVFAQDMFNRAIYLLDKLRDYSEKDWTGYMVGDDVICY